MAQGIYISHEILVLHTHHNIASLYHIEFEWQKSNMKCLLNWTEAEQLTEVAQEMEYERIEWLCTIKCNSLIYKLPLLNETARKFLNN